MIIYSTLSSFTLEQGKKNTQNNTLLTLNLKVKPCLDSLNFQKTKSNDDNYRRLRWHKESHTLETWTLKTSWSLSSLLLYIT